MRETAAERYARIVSIAPWIAARRGVRIEEICERFAISEQDLRADLEVLFMVGVPPYSPDELIDVEIDDGWVYITLGDFFSQPLRLTAAETLGLIAGATLALRTGTHNDEHLQRAIEKLGSNLGGDGELVKVDIDAGDSGVITTVRECLVDRLCVEIEYRSERTGEVAERLVDPWMMLNQGGVLYLLAWCHRAQARRTFRIDRINRAVRTSTSFSLPSEIERPELFGDGVKSSMRLEINPDQQWLIEQFPHHRVAGSPEVVEVEIKVGSVEFARSLLLALGSHAQVQDPASHRDLLISVKVAAERLLGRYSQAH